MNRPLPQISGIPSPDATPYAVREAGVVVIGSGLAGLMAALQLAPQPVTLLTKTARLSSGSSRHAQGGIAAAISPADRPEDHARDTVAAGAGFVDAGRADLLTRDGADLIRQLLADGLPFDRDDRGQPLLGREAAHSIARVVHAGGDATGRMISEALALRVLTTPAITVMTEATVVELTLGQGLVRGVLARHPEGWIFHRAKAVVLATGGSGQLFARTTNPVEATGDGLALAARAGAVLGDLEFVQFHPTALAGAGDPAPLLTEALRGAGALLLDGDGHRFMLDEHGDGELAPRDIVSRAIGKRIAAGEQVFLDLRAVLATRSAEFPTVLGICAAHGIDPFTEPVPVAPAAHYHMGGVMTDEVGRTSVGGLWACGEVACTGVHGANRLASNSLLEALVFGTRVARDIASASNPALAPVALPAPPQIRWGEDLDHIVAAARQALYRGAGLVRDADGLETALFTISSLQDRFDGATLDVASTASASHEQVRCSVELANRLLVSRLLLIAALAREESRGAHWRADFPATDPQATRRHFIATEAEAVLADLTRQHQSQSFGDRKCLSL